MSAASSTQVGDPDFQVLAALGGEAFAQYAEQQQRAAFQQRKAVEQEATARYGHLKDAFVATGSAYVSTEGVSAAADD